MAFLEIRARGEVPAVVGQRPGTAGPDIRFGRKRSSQRPGSAARALEERRPRHSSPSFAGWKAPHFQAGEGRGGTDAPRARRPVRSTAETNARVRSNRASHRGWRSSDRRLFRRQSRHCSIKEIICVICVICGQIAMGAMGAALRFCVLSVRSVPLWFSPDR